MFSDVYKWGYDDGKHSILGGVYEEGEIRAREEEISRDMEKMGKGPRKGPQNMENKEYEYCP